MAGDGDPQVGGSVPDPDDTPEQEPAAHPADPEPGPRPWWEEMPDPWDRPLPHSDDATAEHPLVGQEQQRGGSGREATLRRTAVVVVVVGVVLVGTGALVNLLMPEPTAAPVPPPTPPEQVVSDSPDALSQLGSAPSADPSGGRTVPAPPVVTASPTTSPTPSATASSTNVSLEAETAELGGLAYTSESDQASGGETVRMVGLWGLSSVRFSEVTVAEAGEYELTFHYLGTSDRTGRYSVNDGPETSVDLPGLADGQTVGTVSITVELAEGENTIWFGSSGVAGPELDRVTLIRP